MIRMEINPDRFFTAHPFPAGLFLGIGLSFLGSAAIYICYVLVGLPDSFFFPAGDLYFGAVALFYGVLCGPVFGLVLYLACRKSAQPFPVTSLLLTQFFVSLSLLLLFGGTCCITPFIVCGVFPILTGLFSRRLHTAADADVPSPRLPDRFQSLFLSVFSVVCSALAVLTTTFLILSYRKYFLPYDPYEHGYLYLYLHLLLAAAVPLFVGGGYLGGRLVLQRANVPAAPRILARVGRDLAGVLILAGLTYAGYSLALYSADLYPNRNFCRDIRSAGEALQNEEALYFRKNGAYTDRLEDLDLDSYFWPDNSRAVFSFSRADETGYTFTVTAERCPAYYRFTDKSKSSLINK